MAHYVTVVMDADTHDVIDVVDGDASACLALYSVVPPPSVCGPATQRVAYDQVRRYLARCAFEPVAYVRVALSKEQLYEGETPQP